MTDRRAKERESLAEAAARAARLDEFTRRFRQAKKPANIWAIVDGVTVTVFKREDGLHGWSVAGPGGRPEFSAEVFPTQALAMESLAWHLGVAQGY